MPLLAFQVPEARFTVWWVVTKRFKILQEKLPDQLHQSIVSHLEYEKNQEKYNVAYGYDEAKKRLVKLNAVLVTLPIHSALIRLQEIFYRNSSSYIQIQRECWHHVTLGYVALRIYDTACNVVSMLLQDSLNVNTMFYYDTVLIVDTLFHRDTVWMLTPCCFRLQVDCSFHETLWWSVNVDSIFTIQLEFCLHVTLGYNLNTSISEYVALSYCLYVEYMVL